MKTLVKEKYSGAAKSCACSPNEESAPTSALEWTLQAEVRVANDACLNNNNTQLLPTCDVDWVAMLALCQAASDPALKTSMH